MSNAISSANVLSMRTAPRDPKTGQAVIQFHTPNVPYLVADKDTENDKPSTNLMKKQLDEIPKSVEGPQFMGNVRNDLVQQVPPAMRSAPLMNFLRKRDNMPLEGEDFEDALGELARLREQQSKHLKQIEAMYFEQHGTEDDLDVSDEDQAEAERDQDFQSRFGFKPRKEEPSFDANYSSQKQHLFNWKQESRPMVNGSYSSMFGRSSANEQSEAFRRIANSSRGASARHRAENRSVDGLFDKAQVAKPLKVGGATSPSKPAKEDDGSSRVGGDLQVVQGGEDLLPELTKDKKKKDKKNKKRKDKKKDSEEESPSDAEKKRLKKEKKKEKKRMKKEEKKKCAAEAEMEDDDDKIRVSIDSDAYLDKEIVRPSTAPAREFGKSGRLGETIAQRRLREQLEAEEKEMEYHTTYRFRAKPVPAAVLVPRLERIARAQEKRRNRVREQSLEITRSRERPFSFVERDREQAAKKAETAQLAADMEKQPGFVFRAKPVPMAVTMPLYEKMMSDGDAERQARVQREAQLSLTMASLPPRMEMWAKGHGSQKKLQPEKYPFQPQIVKSVPDFKKLQQDFDEALQRRKQGHKPTGGKPFSFVQDYQKHHEDVINKVRSEIKKDQEKKDASWKSHRVRHDDGVPPPKPTNVTKKHHEEVQKRLLQQKIRSREERLKEKEILRRRKAFGRILKKKLKGKNKKANKELEARRQQFNKEFREMSLNYKHKMDEMMTRVRAQPFLFERFEKDRVNKEKKEARDDAIARFDQQLENAGVDPKMF